MLANYPSVHVHYLAGLVGQIVLQKLAEVAFANESDAGAVLLLGVDKVQLLCNLAHLWFFNVRKRK